ncbi:MAG TPA: S8 family serine peptidase [Nitrospiria bacterium]|nr:S8 family serine peptidase [Nitrospiria bacterium]
MKYPYSMLILLVLAGLFAAQEAAGAQDSRAKLSPRLRMVTSRDPALVESAKRHLRMTINPVSAEPMVDAFVRVKGDPRALEVYGVRVRSVLGDVATAEIPVSVLEAIANRPEVIRIEEARKLKPRLDVSVPASGANGVGLWGGENAANLPGTTGPGSAQSRPLPPPWSGNTGRNVIIGLVDTGIDLKHGDFKDSLGKSRLLYVWDQNTGKECTKQQIDAGTCSEKDADGHGTHVLGIAAGNGAATGNNQPAYRYIGMAPEANLIVVNTTFYDTDIEDGIAYIESKASALGLPAVINLSLAGHLGPHDGTSNFEVAMDNATGTGRVIVAAASNEGNTDNVFPGQLPDFNYPIHASDLGSDKVVDGNVGPTVHFSVPSGSTDVVLDLWYAGADKMGVKVTSPGGSCTAPSSGFQYPGNTTLPFNTNCGQITLTTPTTNVDKLNNGDHEIYIEIQNIGHTISIGSWSFTLTGSNCPPPTPCISNGTFDVWIDDTSSNATFIDNIDYNKTVGMPGTATEVIAVGAYTTKTTWTSSAGAAIDTFGTVKDITYFSSLGPRRTCSNTSNSICTAVVQKPELAAPGEEIMSSHAAGTPTAGYCFANSNQCLDPDGLHVVFQGTSMSTPHVTGAAALLLAQDQSLTADQVKAALENAKSDGNTGAVPNNTWGYGKLAVDQAIATVGTDKHPDPSPNPPANVTAAPGGGSARISWNAITTDIYLDGYNVYKSTNSGGPYTQANTSVVSASSTSFTVTGLTAGTPYYFVVRSEDTPGIESADSSIVTATPTTPSGGGGCGSLRPTVPTTPAGAALFLLSLLLPPLVIHVRRKLRFT